MMHVPLIHTTILPGLVKLTLSFARNTQIRSGRSHPAVEGHPFQAVIHSPCHGPLRIAHRGMKPWHVSKPQSVWNDASSSHSHHYIAWACQTHIIFCNVTLNTHWTIPSCGGRLSFPGRHSQPLPWAFAHRASRHETMARLKAAECLE